LSFWERQGYCLAASSDQQCEPVQQRDSSREA